MQTIAQTARALRDMGDPLPAPYKGFAEQRVSFRRGQVSLLVAAPGVGKTALAVDIVRRLAPHTALYVCVDSDPRDMTGRITASVTGDPTPGDDDLDEYIGYYQGEVTEATGHVRWAWDGAPSVEDIADEMKCYAAVYGSWPELVIIDNLTSLDIELSYGPIQETISSLNQLARNSGAHVLVLHHAVGAYEDGDKVIPLGGIEHKAAKRVAMALTMTRLGSSLRIHVVKNRGGSADARGNRWIPLHADLERMRFEDTA